MIVFRCWKEKGRIQNLKGTGILAFLTGLHKGDSGLWYPFAYVALMHMGRIDPFNPILESRGNRDIPVTSRNWKKGGKVQKQWS